ncbi:MAG TPA: maltotransferase domain-containing protein, partial [Geminicoccaceae bacterium]|nr:maltotransferase domain-containing protein [Geminicoccaceae bacterium]
MPGPRIYNLFPLLAGPVPAWSDHLERIAAMGFDWVYVNPFHYPGFSGSLYAIKDFYRLHPLLAADGTKPETLLRNFTKATAKRGIAVMMDLVINHTSKDAVLVEEHPEWFRRDPDGELRSPRAVDPTDPRKYTVWGDLAEIAYDNPNTRPAMVEYWVDLVKHHLKLGFQGFRCDAAYQVPVAVWQEIIGQAKATDPGCRFFAETLGCTPEQALALKAAGFDFLFNSAKWWDFRAPWLLEQYDLYRKVAPTVAFPESHDTDRLAMELGDPEPAELERHYRLRYLFAAAFSSGVMMPMGYEYGCRKAIDVVGSRPGDWTWETANPRIDLSGFVGEINRMKAATPALNVEGPQRKVTAPHSPVVGLLRLSGGDVVSSDDAAIVLINPDPARLQGIDPGHLINQAGGRIGAFEDVTPDGPALPFAPGHPISMKPLSLRVFRGHAAPLKAVTRLGKAAQQAAEQRLFALAKNRVVIERVTPELDGGRHAIKRVAGDVVEVEADVFCDGHDQIAACLRYRAQDEPEWREAPMALVDNDRWAGRFPVLRNCRYFYTIEAWRDQFESWRGEVMKKHDAGLDVALELIEGQTLIETTHAQADGADKEPLAVLLEELRKLRKDQGRLLQRMLSDEVRALMHRAGIRTNASRYRHELEVFVDRPTAKFAAWYELFPRSQSGDPE